MKKALVIYLSITGNTRKVAKSIYEGILKAGVEVDIVDINQADDLDFYDYSLVCFGAPSYNWHIPKPAEEYLKAKFNRYMKEGRIVPSAPKIEGKNCLIFCTYSGPHTGIREATPAGKYMGQFFEHFGFTVLDEWYILSEFIGSEINSTLGSMGDIRGLPGDKDLERIQQRAFILSSNI
ncbi:MAG: flavodoxin domain-containing protein [Oscillospiraceae bacterium]|nr:flavodoxin domain-containing protein [Oscillospiraceae bacterium]